MRRLRHREVAVADAQSRRHSETADQPRRLVREDVAEHVGGDDDVETLRIANQPHRHRVDDDLVDGHIRKILGGAIALLDEHAAAELEDGVLVDEREKLACGFARDLEARLVQRVRCRPA